MDAEYEIKSVEVLPNFDAIRERHYCITAAEAAQVHKDWFPRYRELYHPKTVELLERGQTITNNQLQEALAGRERLQDELEKLMDAHGVDMWIAPSAPGPAPKGLDSTGDPVMNLPWTQAGMPAINLPAGRSAGGLPLGLQLTARFNADENLLAWAGEIENVLQTR